MAQAHQGQGCAVGELPGDVGELAAVAEGDAGHLGQGSRALAASRWRSEVLVGFRWLGYMTIVPDPVGSVMKAVPCSPAVICLDDAERAELESVSRRATAPHRLVLRARIVLLAG
ncbi:hypothetical protein LUW76_30380 [Actinomadura madurae]|uniref:hypothetical protein n=2 Tax=Actinomadura madurae TaxID=1993 RepID=UPI002026D612|nr:hypothetical protein [Actinomadura madurae]URM98318.1 hypothetical protein LUW76_30380 [Actinomadura madurae]URN09008.1 hypothetical protein LUW74_40405 [Actinomadura madurae]